MKKSIKRSISMLLAVLMLVCVMSVGVSADAAKAEPFRYVALGDSTALGYYMDGFCDYYQRADDLSETALWSTFRMFGDYLKENIDGREVITKDLGLTGMRPAELRAILDEDYYARFNLDPNRTENYVDEHINYYTAPQAAHTGDGGSHGYGSYANIHKIFTEELANADLITYDLSMVDYGGYFAYRLMDMNDPFYTQDSFANIMKDEGYSQIAEGAAALESALMALLNATDLPADMLDQFLNAMLYCYASFTINFSATMDLIYKLNPDVEMIVVSPFNTMDGVVFTYENIEIDLGQCWNILMEAIGAHIIAVDKHSGQYHYADLRGGVGLCIDTMASGNYDGYSVLYDLLMNDDAVKMMKNAGMTEEEIVAAVAKGAQCSTIPLADLLPLLTSGDPMSAMTDYALPAMLDIDNATPAQLALIHVYLRMIITHAAGCHPNIDGYKQKTDAIIKAYNSHYTANGTYVERAVSDIFAFAENLVGAILGFEESVDYIKTAISNIFKLPIRFGLFG